MGKKDKLIEKLRTKPKSFSFDDTVTLPGYFKYNVDNKGKTSGSRIMFKNDENNTRITLHKPHPQKELREYQVKQLIEHLEEEGFI